MPAATVLDLTAARAARRPGPPSAPSPNPLVAEAAAADDPLLALWTVRSTRLAEERLPVPPRPLPLTPGGLLAWADSTTWTDLRPTYTEPASATCPLPPVAQREHRGAMRGAWYVGDVPAEAIAHDLTAAGVTFAPGVGYARQGERLDAEDVARLAARVLDETADRLPEPPALVEAEADACALAEATAYADAYDRVVETWEAEASALVGGEAYYSGEPVSLDFGASVIVYVNADAAAHALNWTRPSRGLVAALVATAPADPDVVNAHAALLDTLHTTAATIRRSAPARRALLARLRPLLSAPSTPRADLDAASAFLAAYDDENRVSRPALVRAYAAAGRPGDLDDNGVRALAAARWGDVVKVRGTDHYRPNNTTRSR